MEIMVLIDMHEEEIKKHGEDVLDINVDLSTRYGIVLSIITNNYDYFYEWVDNMPFFKNVDSEGVEIMEDKNRTLSNYRLQKAKEDLETAKLTYQHNKLAQ